MMRMRKEILLAVCSALFLNAGAYAQYNGSSAYMDLYDSETASALKSHVRELSSAMMEGRKAGSKVSALPLIMFRNSSGAMALMCSHRKEGMFSVSGQKPGIL